MVEVNTFTLQVPRIPPSLSLNARLDPKDRYNKQSTAKRFLRRHLVEALEQYEGLLPFLYYDFYIHVVFPDRGDRDLDNVVASCKGWLDVLSEKRNQVILDDSNQFMRSLLITQEYKASVSSTTFVLRRLTKKQMTETPYLL